MPGISQETLEKLKAIPILDVCERLGIDVAPRRNVRCINPMHEDKHPSMKIDAGHNRWKCFACGAGGDVIQLVSVYHGLSFVDACNWLAGQFHVHDVSKFCCVKPQRIERPQPKPLKKEKHIEPDSELLEWIISTGGLSAEAKRFLFEERLLSPEVIKRCRIISISNEEKFCAALVNRFDETRCLRSGIIYKDKFGRLKSHFILPAIAFPFCDYYGKIVNIQTRTMSPKSPSERFRFIKCYPLIPFNLNSLCGLTANSVVFITEGVTDCLAVLSEGKNAVAIPGASNFKHEFGKYFDKFAVVMFPDRDKAGMQLMQTIHSSLNCMVLCSSLPNGLKDYAAYHVRNFSD
jgi:DNA primase